MRSNRVLVVGGLSSLLLALPVAEARATPPDWWDPAWLGRIGVDLTEPGITDRNAEYVDLVIDFPPGRYTDLAAEVRVIDDAGVEVPSLVHSQVGDQAHVLINTSVAMGATESVDVYFGNAAAVPPAYVFPDVPAIFYVYDPAALGSWEVNLEANMESLSLYGQIGIAIELADGDTDYDQAVARTLRIAFVTGQCSTEQILEMTSIYDDVSIWGVSNGNCLEQFIFGLTDSPEGGTVTVPATTDYVTQDYTPGQVLSFSCNQSASPNAGGVVEVTTVNATVGCMLRFDGGHTLPNMHTLQYRSYFSGETDIFDVDATTIHQRAAELLLQENRVDALPGMPETIDTDGDTILDRMDNCPMDPNPMQDNADMDMLGDACDPCPNDADNDVDMDAICGDEDNCPDDANPMQQDADGDGIGDACDGSGDSSGEGGESTDGADSTADGTDSTGGGTDGSGGNDGATTGGISDTVMSSVTLSGGSGGDDGGTGGSSGGLLDGGDGCGCRSPGPDRQGPVGSLAGLLALLGLRRRRPSAA